MSHSIRVGELLVILLIVLFAFIAGSFTSSFIAASQVENHIDNTIKTTVQQAEASAAGSQATEIKNLNTALNQAVAVIESECNTITALHGTCPQVHITVPPS
jgi:hypothetical protein